MSASGKSKRRLIEDAVREHLTDEGLVVGRVALREDPPEILTAGEAAALLRVDDVELVAAAERRELPGRMIAGEWRFSRSALLSWLDQVVDATGGARRDPDRGDPDRGDPDRRDPDRGETLVETGLEYKPGDPVLVRVVRRGHRISVTDDGAAIEKAGRPPHWRDVADRLAEELDVNVSQHGIISLPVVRVGPGEEKIVERIGAASLAFYQDLLELERSRPRDIRRQANSPGAKRPST